ncbi:unnamed protein product [Brassica rapa]|uniref:thioglucosidase n=1 Tax=Brassica campestris TaxID=3711 RepID=A0A3P6BLA4_BRACM|nr:unnamed protein product [Brassica rapa]VDD03448.1 unnamed protein product [Brassica rapa]
MYKTKGIGSQPFTAAMNVYSEGLRNLLKYIKDNYANPEIMIMENGYGEELGATDSIKMVLLIIIGNTISRGIF